MPIHKVHSFSVHLYCILSLIHSCGKQLVPACGMKLIRKSVKLHSEPSKYKYRSKATLNSALYSGLRISKSKGNCPIENERRCKYIVNYLQVIGEGEVRWTIAAKMKAQCISKGWKNIRLFIITHCFTIIFNRKILEELISSFARE